MNTNKNMADLTFEMVVVEVITIEMELIESEFT